MATFTRIEEILAWQKARELVKYTYLLTRAGPLSKDFGLRDQLQRAAVSSMSNIAEGFGRHSHRDFARHLDIARGSAIEVQSLLYVAKDVGYLPETDFTHLFKLADEVLSLIGGLHRYLRQTNP